MSRRRFSAIAIGGALLAVGIAATLLAMTREPAATALPAPRFVDEAAGAGIDHRYDGEFTHFVGGGVAVLDCDADGDSDLFFAGGSSPAALYRNRSEPGGALAFAPVASAATDLDGVTGAYPLDVDADGVVDLAVLRVGENVLLRGTGDCGFERANERWGFEGGDAWSVALSATWEDESALPTLAIGNYLVLDDDERPVPSYDCDGNELHRPEAGTYASPSALRPGWCTLSLLFSDWSRTGRRDLRVSNDRHYASQAQEQLWRMEAGAAPELWTPAEGWQPLRIWGMGIASHDLTGDGYPEVYLTSQADNKLQTLANGASTRPEYADIAIRRGATAHRPYAGDIGMRSTAWHPEFADVNNDGLIDLFVSKGNVEAMTEYAARDPNNLLIGQPDGTFVEGGEAAGIATFLRARGAALADLNLDGLLDLVVVNRRENVQVWRNVGTGDAASPTPMGGWVAVRLQQPGANRDAIGAWIEVRAGEGITRHELTVGGGHASGQLGWSHFGIGEADRVEIRVTWPDGELGPWQEVAANGFSVIDRASGEIAPWSPAD